MLKKIGLHRFGIPAIICVGILLRLGIIVVTDGGIDLHIYRYFGNLALHGINPYEDAPLNGPIKAYYADNPPFHMLFFAGLLAIHNSHLTIRLFFVFCDAITMIVIARYPGRTRLWKRRFLAFYALNPLILMWWTGFSQDKTIVFLLLTLTLLGLESNYLKTTWAATTFLGCLKWMGGFFLPSLFVETIRGQGLKAAALLVAGFFALFALSNLAWFPSNLIALERRNNRIKFDPPIHLSITRILSEVGLYDPMIPALGIPLALVILFVLHLRHKVGIQEVVALSTLASYLLLPDEGHNRILMITLPLLFIIPAKDWKRWQVWWSVSCIQALLTYNTFAQTDNRISIELLNNIFGGPGSLREVLIANALLLTVIASYLKARFSSEWMPSRIFPR